MTRYTVAIDETPAGWKTVEWVNTCVGQPTDSVRLLTVSEFYGEALTRSEQRLHEAAALVHKAHPDLEVEEDVTGGPTADRLVFDAGEGDVLVIGGNQVHRFLAALSGRVAERVVAHAVTPVVVVPERWVASSGPVVVGVDSRTAASALAFAADVASQQGRRLVFVRAWELPSVASPYGMVYLDTDRKLWEHESQLELDAAIRAVSRSHPDLVTRAEMRQGSPRGVMVRAAEEASLVVVGRRHRTAIGAFLLGSVSETLMHEGQTPVCIVPPMSVAAVRREAVAQTTSERA
jgi:nucleotide-binding universal stress UspA family protein